MLHSNKEVNYSKSAFNVKIKHLFMSVANEASIPIKLIIFRIHVSD